MPTCGSSLGLEHSHSLWCARVMRVSPVWGQWNGPNWKAKCAWEQCSACDPCDPATTEEGDAGWTDPLAGTWHDPPPA